VKYLRIYRDKGRLRISEQAEVSRSLRERVLVIDTNLAIDHAMRFVEDGLEVYYWLANLSAFPHFEDQIGGDGLGVEKVEDWAQVVDKVRLVYITDSCFPHLAQRLRDLGKLVYGPTAELVRWEQDRGYAYQKMQEAGVRVPYGAVLKGKEEVVRWISRREDGERRFWIKVSRYRGNIETFSVSSAREAEAMLSQSGFGPYLDNLEFLVQEHIEGIELGSDAFVVPSGVLEPISYTIEEKGRGNIAVWQRRSDFLQEWYEKVHAVVEDTDYRCNLSVEGIWDGGSLFVLEPTPRNPYPVSSLYPRFVYNFTDVIYAVAEDRVIDLDVDWENPYMMEVTVSTGETKLWRVIEVADGLVNWSGEGVGFRRVVRKGGKYWYCPGDPVVATVNVKGESVEECVKKSKELLKEVSCLFSEYDGTFFESVQEKVRRLGEIGVKFRFEVRR